MAQNDVLRLIIDICQQNQQEMMTKTDVESILQIYSLLISSIISAAGASIKMSEGMIDEREYRTPDTIGNGGLSAEQCAAVIRRCIGSIEPIGDASIDNPRFDNLTQFCRLIDLLLHDVQSAAAFAVCQEGSRQRIGQYASEYIAARTDPSSAL